MICSFPATPRAGQARLVSARLARGRARCRTPPTKMMNRLLHHLPSSQASKCMKEDGPTPSLKRRALWLICRAKRFDCHADFSEGLELVATSLDHFANDLRVLQAGTTELTNSSACEIRSSLKETGFVTRCEIWCSIRLVNVNSCV